MSDLTVLGRAAVKDSTPPNARSWVLAAPVAAYVTLRDAADGGSAQ